jgi:hypothetical protein
MRPYKREKLGTLALMALMGMNGTVFASELQVIPKNGVIENSVVENVNKNNYSLSSSKKFSSSLNQSFSDKNLKRTRRNN